MAIKLEINVETASELAKDVAELAKFLGIGRAISEVVDSAIHQMAEDEGDEGEDEAPEAPEAEASSKRVDIEIPEAPVKPKKVRRTKAELAAAKALEEAPPVVAAPTPEYVEPVAVEAAPANIPTLQPFNPAPPIFETPTALQVEQPIPVAAPAPTAYVPSTAGMDFSGLNVALPNNPIVAPTPEASHEVAVAQTLSPWHGNIIKSAEPYLYSADQEVAKRYLMVYENFTPNKGQVDANGYVIFEPADFDEESANNLLGSMEFYKNWILTGQQ